MVAQPSESATTQPNPLDTLEIIQTKLHHLSLEQQQEVLDFVEFLVQKHQIPEPKKTIWEKIDERMAEVPDEVWEKVPTDGSYQHDHYLYGTPMREL